MTMHTMEAAKSSPEVKVNDKTVPAEPAKPGYYVLLPLAVAADIVAAPFYLFMAWKLHE